jgi:hypothetical protein
MEPARTRIWWTAAGVVLVAFVVAATFSAYLRPDMLLVFGDVMAFCVGLIR